MVRIILNHKNTIKNKDNIKLSLFAEHYDLLIDKGRRANRLDQDSKKCAYRNIMTVWRI